MKNNKRMPIYLMVLTDILLSAASIGVFMLFDYVLPQKSSESGTVITTTDDTDSAMFELPNKSDSTDSSEDSSNSDSTTSSTATEDSTADESKSSGNKTNSHSNRGNGYSNTDTTDISSDSVSTNLDGTVTEVGSYTNDNADITVSKVTAGSDSNTVTYYVADVYVTNAKYIQTGLATGSFGKNLRESVIDMADDNNAMLAISGDYYGNSEDTLVIRNGVLYREASASTDICVLFSDGTMQVYSSDEFNADEVIAAGAWQAWNFGPILVENGEIPSSYNTTSYINSENPRCAIGCVEAGHYVMVVVDGRDEGYSRGMTLSELSQVMVNLGCQTAFNLDGGKSSAMVFDGEYTNEPADGGREISDIIYIAQ